MNLNLQDRRFHLALGFCALITVVYLLFFRSGPASYLTASEINQILSGTDEGSDIEKVPVLQFSLRAPYLQSDLSSPDWNVDGDTLVKNNEYVRLTSEKKNQAGLIFNKRSFTHQGFQIDFKFSIHGESKGHGLKADGFAMFLTDKQLGLGTVFGAEDYFNGLGLFFDTYRNAKKGKVFPYISVMNGDGNTPYDKDHDGKANELGGCSARNIYNTKRGFVEARLLHTAEDGYLSLDFSTTDGKWENCFSIKDVHIPKYKHLGFGAATGDLYENVDLFNVDLYQLQHHGKEVRSFQEFVEDEAQEEKQEQKEEEQAKFDRREPKRRRNAQQRAKLRAKMRNKERRLQKRINEERARSANEPGFFSTLWWLIKTTLITLTIIVTLYIAFTIYRVKKRTWKYQKKHTGLLD